MRWGLPCSRSARLCQESLSLLGELHQPLLLCSARWSWSYPSSVLGTASLPMLRAGKTTPGFPLTWGEFRLEHLKEKVSK